MLNKYRFSSEIKMKVLHILTGGKPGGIETLCREIGLNSRQKHGFCFMSFGGEIYEQMDRLGLTTYPLFVYGKKWSFHKLHKLLEITKEYDVLMVHHEDPYVETYYIIDKFITKKKGVRYIHSCYSDPLNKNKNMVKQLLNHLTRQLSICYADRIIIVSKAGLKSALEEYHINQSKCCIIYNGISKRFIETGLSNNVFKNEGIEILYAGRLVPIKGVSMLLDALALLKERYCFHLSVLGDGEERTNLEKKANDKKLNCTFFGSQTNMEEYYRKADIFVYPSVVQEIFGISIVEAMAFGIPCVANRVGGIPEVIEDGYNGFLTESISIESLCKTIERTINIRTNVEEICRLSENAKIRAREFSIANTCDELDALLDNMFI